MTIPVHPEMEDRIIKYISQGMLNTIFYGGRGVGKHSLVLKMLNSINKNSHEKEKVRYWENTGVRFYATSAYIRFDAKECLRRKANLPMIIEEIGRTRDILADNHRIIYIRNLNYLGEQQEVFRQLVEDTYLTCRYVFTCRNIDSIDPALNSRCFLICVPSPSVGTLTTIAEGALPQNTPPDIIRQIVHMSDRNMNTMKHLIMLRKKIVHGVDKDKNACPNIVANLGKSIQSSLAESPNLSTIHQLADKYHHSELCILDICKHMDGTAKFAPEIQRYSSLACPTIYDTLLLFLEIAKVCNDRFEF